MAILPATNTKQVTHHIALLLAIQLRHVFVRAHDEVFDEPEMKRRLVLDKVKVSRFRLGFFRSEPILVTMSSKLNLLSYAWCMGLSSLKRFWEKNESESF